MSTRRLLIDAGNTRLKWVVVEAGQWCAQGHCDYADWSGLKAELRATMLCHIASVTHAEREQELAALLQAAQIKPTWLRAEAAFGDLTNTYQDPAQLGVDRWMGLIAARRRTHEPVLVVSVGTAMTVDALSADGQFLGGIIVPGIALMRHALQQGTARVTDVAGALQAFPRNTADAVESGVTAALCGAILQQHARLAESVQRLPQCLLTGGDGGRLLPHLAVPVESVPALVLEGIDCVVREGLSR